MCGAGPATRTEFFALRTADIDSPPPIDSPRFRSTPPVTIACGDSLPAAAHHLQTARRDLPLLSRRLARSPPAVRRRLDRRHRHLASLQPGHPVSHLRSEEAARELPGMDGQLG